MLPHMYSAYNQYKTPVIPLNNLKNTLGSTNAISNLNSELIINLPLSRHKENKSP
jgi:hypothetical protein